MHSRWGHWYKKEYRYHCRRRRRRKEALGVLEFLIFINFSVYIQLCVDFIRFYNLKNIDEGLLHSRELSIALGYRFFLERNSVTSIPRTSIHLSHPFLILALLGLASYSSALRVSIFRCLTTIYRSLDYYSRYTILIWYLSMLVLITWRIIIVYIF